MDQKPEHIMQFFKFDHLPEHPQAISKPFCVLAEKIVGQTLNGDHIAEGSGLTTHFPIPRNPERTVALRKLLEAKDAAVRAFIAKEG